MQQLLEPLAVIQFSETLLLILLLLVAVAALQINRLLGVWLAGLAAAVPVRPLPVQVEQEIPLRLVPPKEAMEEIVDLVILVVVVVVQVLLAVTHQVLLVLLREVLVEMAQRLLFLDLP
jgi:hypothetical protein